MNGHGTPCDTSHWPSAEDLCKRGMTERKLLPVGAGMEVTEVAGDMVEAGEKKNHTQ